MLKTLPRLRDSVAVWVTWIESMSCPFIKWADSNGRNSNSGTRWKTFSLQLAKRLNKLARGFGPRGSKFTDYEIPSGWLERNLTGARAISLTRVKRRYP